MTTSEYHVRAIEPFPIVREGDQLADLIADSLGELVLTDGDVVVIASKVISIEEKRRVDLAVVQPSPEARSLSRHTGKDPRIVELILQESTRHYLAGERGPIIARHRLGYELTSAGVDREGPDGAYLLPEDPDSSARRIRSALLRRTGAEVAVIVADSDGRADRAGATVIAIGSAGIAPLRFSTITSVDGSTKIQDETLVDLLAAAAGVVLGQRGRGAPVAVLRGVGYLPADQGVRSILHD